LLFRSQPGTEFQERAFLEEAGELFMESRVEAELTD
jgi:hypothetical protein